MSTVLSSIVFGAMLLCAVLCTMHARIYAILHHLDCKDAVRLKIRVDAGIMEGIMGRLEMFAIGVRVKVRVRIRFSGFSVSTELGLVVVSLWIV